MITSSFEKKFQIYSHLTGVSWTRSAGELRRWGHVSPLYRSTTLPLGLFASSDPGYGGSLFYITNVLLRGPGVVRYHSDRITDTSSLTNANSAVADVLLRGLAQGRGISQSPQEYPAGAVDVPVYPDAIGTCHCPTSAQVRNYFP